MGRGRSHRLAPKKSQPTEVSSAACRKGTVSAQLPGCTRPSFLKRTSGTVRRIRFKTFAHQRGSVETRDVIITLNASRANFGYARSRTPNAYLRVGFFDGDGSETQADQYPGAPAECHCGALGGSCWREILDHVIALNEQHLPRLIREYVATDRVVLFGSTPLRGPVNTQACGPGV